MKRQPATAPQQADRQPARSGRPSQGASALLGDHILSTALRQFVLRGVDGATIEGIATAAGVTKRTLYLRYGSKEGLLRAVIGLDSAPVVADIAAAAPSGSLKERLLFVAGSYLDLSLTPEARDFTLLMDQIFHSRPELVDGASAARVKPLIDLAGHAHRGGGADSERR